MNNSLYLQISHLLVPFKQQMKNLMFIATLLFSSLSFAANLEINCSDNQCNSTDLTTAYTNSCATIINKSQCEAKVLGNLCQWIDDANANGGNCTSIPQSKICAGFNCAAGETMSVIKIRGILDLDLNVLTNSSGHPQNLGISINNGAFPGKNANLAINAQNQTAHGANVILVGDNFNNLNINLDGYNGKTGKSASEICADKIKHGDYGPNLQAYFNQRRSTTSADPSRCDSDDLNYMQTYNFSCDDPAFHEIQDVNNPVVQVSQVKKLARCNAVASYSYCIKRKVQINCNFRLWSTYHQTYLFDGAYFDTPSYYNGPQNCQAAYTSCGSVSGSCQNGQISQISPASGYNTSTSFNYGQCIYNSSHTSICGPSGYTSFYAQEGFYKSDVCSSTQIAGMPLTRSTTVGPFDEDFFNNEANRLGGIDRFCDAYGNIPGKGDQQWWGGVAGAPGPTSGSGVETSGIPWEYIGTGGVTPGASLVWQSETQQFGGYPANINGYQVITGYSSGYSYYGGGSGYAYPIYATRYRVKSSYWKGYGSSVTFTSPGLNPDGLSLAPGSSWEIRQTNTFENCPGGWTNLKNIFVNLVQYVNKENTSCSGVTDPLDPNNRAFWQYTGITQEPTFGTEFVSCGIGSCAVGSTVSELSRSLDTIAPGSGEDGTEQGRGLLFVYDIKSLNSRALPGSSGAVGSADVNVNPQTRICVKIDDANAGINTEQAKSPFVSFRRYQWQAVKSTTSGNPGTPPRNTGKDVEVFRKLDPASRYLLDKSLL